MNSEARVARRGATVRNGRSAAGVLHAMAAAGVCASGAFGAAACPGDSESAEGGRIAVTRVSTFLASSQHNGAIDTLADGSLMMVWESRRQEEGTPGIFAQRVSSLGVRTGAEMHVNVYTASAQSEPAVAAAADGGAWVVWSSHGQDEQGWGVVARRFGANLEQASDEIGINSTQHGDQTTPVVASHGTGSALFAWVSSPGDEFKPRVVMRVFDDCGSAVTDEFDPDPTDTARTHSPTVCATPDGFVLAWARSDAATGEPLGVRVARLDADGDVVGEPVDAAGRGEGGGSGVEPALASDRRGRFVVAWMAREGERYVGMARWFEASGAPASGAVRVHEADDRFKSGVAVVMKPDGGETAFVYNSEDESGRESRVVAVTHAFGGAASGEPMVLASGDEDQRFGLDIASGARRVTLTGDGRIAASVGGPGDGDKDAALLAMALPAGVALPVAPAVELGVAREMTIAAAEPTHTPPTFNRRDIQSDKRLPDLDPGRADFGFEAVQNTGWTPPDPEMAVGPNHIVTMTNGEISFFEKSGVQTFQDEIENSFGFWGSKGAGNFVFDPECLYDPHSGRFMAMACERTGGQSYFLFAVSDDSDPNGTWHKYRFNVTALAGNDIDSPNMAVDASAVYLTADFFSPSDKYLIYMIPKATVLTGGTPTSTSLLLTGRQSIGLPITHSAGSPAQYMLESTELTSNTQLKVHAIQNALTTPTRVETTLTVPAYRYPGTPVQQGTSVRPTLFEPRFWSCVEKNGSIWAVHHITVSGNSVTRARWYQIALNGWPASGNLPSVVQQGDIVPGTSVYAFFPSIDADQDGNAAITFARSSSTEFISMSRAIRRHDDAPGTFRSPEFVKTSSAPETSGRWGDYSGTKADPTTCRVFWGHHEWNPGPWRTWVARYNVPTPADWNNDGTLDAFDYDDFVSDFFNAILNGTNTADFNGDGSTDAFDYDDFVDVYFRELC